MKISENSNGRTILTADKNKIITDGNNIFGKIVYLSKGETADPYSEITEDEYNKLINEQIEPELDNFEEGD